MDAICNFDLQAFTGEMKHLSTAVKHLLRKMLEKKPEQRLTAKTALRHPWFINAKFFGAEHSTPRRRLNRMSSSSIEISDTDKEDIDDQKKKSPEEQACFHIQPVVQDIYEENTQAQIPYSAESVLVIMAFIQQERNIRVPDYITEEIPEDFDDRLRQERPFRHRNSMNDLESLVEKPKKIKKLSADERERGVIQVRSLESDESPDGSTPPQGGTLQAMEKMNIFLAPLDTVVKSDLLEALDHHQHYLRKINKIGIGRSQSFN